MDENQDLAKQYQDILDRYSRELANSTAPLETVKPTESEPSLLTESVPKPVSPVEAPIALEPSVAEALPPPISIPTQEPIVTPPPAPSKFFKYLFFFSLIIFLAVSGLIIYSMLNPGTSSQPETTIPTSKPTMPVPTVNSSQVCVVNDMSYQVGESFVADDGCNTCSCGVDLTIVCTQKACDATPSTKLVPTLKPSLAPKATVTLKATPTSIVLIPKKQTLPVDLVSVIKFNVKKESTVSLTDNQIIIGNSVLSGNFAQVSWNIQNSSGAIYWLTKVGGSWQLVANGQETPSCSLLAKFSFPTTFSCSK